MKTYILAVAVILLIMQTTTLAQTREPGWMRQVVVRGEIRRRIEQTPIEYRPYRPLHFYGNTVRRMYYHGRVLPVPGEMRRSFGSRASRR